MPEEINQNIPAGIMSEFNVPVPENTEAVKEEATQVIPEVHSEEKVVVPEQNQPPVETDWFDIQKINERLGSEFQSEDEIKETISSLKANADYLNKKDYYSTLEESLTNLVDTFNPVKRFGSKEAYEAAVVENTLKQSNHPYVVANLMSGDVGKIDDLEALYLDMVNRAPELLTSYSPETIKKGILGQFGVDTNDPDLDISKYKEVFKDNITGLVNMTSKATDVKKSFKGLIDQAKSNVQEFQDLQSVIEAKTQERIKAQQEAVVAQQKLKDEWTGKAKDLADQFTKIEFKDKDASGKEYVDFTFDVPKDFLQKVTPYLIDYAVKNNLEVNQQSIGKITEELRDFIEDEYREQIRKAYANDRVSKAKEEIDIKVLNQKPISTQEAPPEQSKEYDESHFRKMWGL